MLHKRSLHIVLFVTFIMLLSWSSVVGKEDISKVDFEVWDELQRSDSADLLILMDEQADLSAAYSISDWEARGKYVLDTLQEVARRSQAPVVAFAKSQGLAFRSFFSSNALYLPGSSGGAVRSLASLPGIRSIELAGAYHLPPPQPFESFSATSQAIGWNLDTLDPAGSAFGMQAAQVWDQYGINGDGITVASIDTGVRYSHEALIRQYRGNLGDGFFDHDYNWYQPNAGCGDGSYPCDNHLPGHGTKVTGIMVGENISLTEQIGVAPTADWIACAGCEADGGCPDIAMLACAEWILAPCPIGSNPGDALCDAALRPHIVNNSWGARYREDRMWFQSIVVAWRAAGIFPAFAAGNDFDCEALYSPGDYLESFASAGHSEEGYNVGSGGPSTAQGAEDAVKPNLNAPTNGLSSDARGDDIYSILDGTSGSSPHTAGAVALCWSANPELKGNVAATFDLLHQTARDTLDPGDCGLLDPEQPLSTPNYQHGWGYLDALALVEACTSGQLVGHIYNASDNSPIAGASLDIDGGIISDATGAYSVTLPVGTYDVTAGAVGYYSVTETGLTISPGTTLVQDFSLPLGWTVAPTTPFQFTAFDAVFVPGPENEDWANKVYFPGGLNGASGVESADIWVYDPYTGVYFDTQDDMPLGVSHYTANLIPGATQDCEGPAIYIVGGTNDETLIDLVQWYCVPSGETGTSDPWRPETGPIVTYLPGGTVVVDDRIYVFGGWQGEDPSYLADWTWRFDPSANGGEQKQWEDLGLTLSEPRAYIGTAVLGSRIFALGGVAGYVPPDAEDLIPTDVVEVLDTVDLASGWQALESMPQPTGEGRAFGLDADTLHQLGLHASTGWIPYVGGGDWPDSSPEVWVYDQLRDGWEQPFPRIHQPRRDHAGEFIPLCSQARYDGLPGIWVWGGEVDGTEPSYGDPEYLSFICYTDFAYLPIVMK